MVVKALIFAKSLKKEFEIIKAFAVDTTFDFSVLEPYEFVCDYFFVGQQGKIAWRQRQAF